MFRLVFKFLDAEENINHLKNILPRHQATLIQQFYASVTLHPFQKVCVEWGVRLEGLAMIDQTPTGHRLKGPMHTIQM